jgi:hypothetical protein
VDEKRRVEEDRREYGEQDEFGNSIDNLRANLKLTPIERISKAEAMARFIAKFRGVAHKHGRD